MAFEEGGGSSVGSGPGIGISIGPCDCCGSSSSTTTTTTAESTTTGTTQSTTTGTTQSTTTGTTGTTTTGTTQSTTTGTTQSTTTQSTTTGTTGTTTTGTGTGTSFDCCTYWDNGSLNFPTTVDLSNPSSCECGGSGEGDLQSNGNGTWSGNILICDPITCTTDDPDCVFAGLSLNLTVKCPSVSTSGNWELDWALTGECSASGTESSPLSFTCNETSFRICFGPIGGIPSNSCCDCDCDGNGGTGSGSWEICIEDS